MRLHPSFFKPPRRAADATMLAKKRGPPSPRIKREETAPTSILRMPADAGRPAGGETRKISPNLTVTVISNSMRDKAREERRPQDHKSAPEISSAGATSLAKKPSSSRSLATSFQEEGDGRDSVGDGYEVDEVTPSYAHSHSACTSIFSASHRGARSYGTATTSLGDEDSVTTLSDLTASYRSWRSADATLEEGWRQRLACGVLPACGEGDAGDAILEDYPTYSSDESFSHPGERAAGCFVLG